MIGQFDHGRLKLYPLGLMRREVPLEKMRGNLNWNIVFSQVMHFIKVVMWAFWRSNHATSVLGVESKQISITNKNNYVNVIQQNV